MAQFDHYPTWRTLPVHLFDGGERTHESVCPRCGTDTLVAGSWNERCVHQCQRCLGLWLTPPVLDALARLQEMSRRRATRQMPYQDQREALALSAAREVVRQTTGWYRSAG